MTTKIPQQQSQPEESAWLQIKAAKVELPQREYQFTTFRKWRFDFAWPGYKIALEIEGGTASGKSRHSYGAGFENDCDKYNHATFHGWQVYRLTSRQVIKEARVEGLVRTVLPSVAVHG